MIPPDIKDFLLNALTIVEHSLTKRKISVNEYTDTMKLVRQCLKVLEQEKICSMYTRGK